MGPYKWVTGVTDPYEWSYIISLLRSGTPKLIWVVFQRLFWVGLKQWVYLCVCVWVKLCFEELIMKMGFPDFGIHCWVQLFQSNKRGGQDVPFISNFNFFSSRGQWPIHESIANEATHELGGYHDWSSWRTCFRDDHMVIQQCLVSPFWFSCLSSCWFDHFPSHAQFLYVEFSIIPRFPNCLQAGVNQFVWFCTVTYSWPSINFQASFFSLLEITWLMASHKMVT